MRKLIRNRKGQGLVEYALIIAGVARSASWESRCSATRSPT